MPFGPNYAEQILGSTVLGSPFTPVNTVFVSLCSSIGSVGLSYAEPSAGGYARQVITFGTLSNRRSKNTNNVAFPAPTTPWGNIPHVALFDAVSSGNIIAYATLSSTKTIITSMVMTISINSLTFRVD